jgi:hypothetical protein
VATHPLAGLLIDVSELQRAYYERGPIPATRTIGFAAQEGIEHYHQALYAAAGAPPGTEGFPRRTA